MRTPAPPETTPPQATQPQATTPQATTPETTTPECDDLGTQLPRAGKPPDPIEQLILALTAERGPGKSICPSEVARALLPGSTQDRWQSLMTPVRQAAIRLVAAGRIDILRKGKPAPPGDVKGVIRLRTRTAAPVADAP